jgi:hypothetical protein
VASDIRVATHRTVHEAAHRGNWLAAMAIKDLDMIRGGPRNGPRPGLAHVCRLKATGLHDILANFKENFSAYLGLSPGLQHGLPWVQIRPWT